MAPNYTIKAPSELQFVPFPPFGLKWYATPPAYYNGGGGPLEENLPPRPPNCTAVAICGGGGAARTGFKNCVHIVLTLSSEGIDGSHSQERTVDIDTGLGCAIDVALHQVGGMLWVLVAIGKGFSLYFVPIVAGDGNSDGGAEGREYTVPDEGGGDTGGDESVLMAEGTFDEKTGCEAISFNPDGSVFAAGYENGKISIFTVDYGPSPDSDNDDDEIRLTKYAELQQEGLRHIKAIDTLQFHPTNPAILASCAKDGTCRIWDLKDKTCIDTLYPKIYDIRKPPPDDKKITDPKPGQLLVRGCAFGDPDGHILYTVQSGRRTSAYLSVWQLVRPPIGQPGEPQQSQLPIFEEVLRKCVAPLPISAMSLSGDYSTIALGDTDGTVTLYDTTRNMKRIKRWTKAHETPVTCIAARPVGPFSDLPGEERTGVTVDVLTASFDNKLLFLTKQKKSRLVVPGPRPSIMFYLVNGLLVVCIAFVIVVSYDACREEMREFMDLQPIRDCLVHTVMWAPVDRPGVSMVPM